MAKSAKPATTGTTTELAQQDGQPLLEAAIKQVAQQSLTSYGISDQLIDELKNDYGKLTIAGPDDAATYETATTAIARVRKLRTGVEATRKRIKQPFWDAGVAIDNEAKRITAELEPIERHLAGQIQTVDAERERRRKAEEVRRINLLNAAGFTLVGQAYVAGAIVLHWDDVTNLTVEQFEKVVADGKAAIEAQRIEQERQRQEQERIANERAELERLKAEIEAREAALKAKEQPEPQPEPQRDWFGSGGSSEFAYPQQQPQPQEWPKPNTAGAFTAPRPQANTNTGIFPQPTATAPVPSQKSVYFMDGFEAAKAKIIKTFTEDATPRKRAEWVEIFKNLKP